MPLCHHWSTAPMPMDQKRAWALMSASPPAAWRLRSVSAAAMPLGNLSCSRLISWRFIGMAIETPRKARKAVQAMRTFQFMWTPVSMSCAAMAETMVPPVETPALVAVDCMQLFSRIDMGCLAQPNFKKTVQMA